MNRTHAVTTRRRTTECLASEIEPGRGILDDWESGLRETHAQFKASRRAERGEAVKAGGEDDGG